jgi:hypothetical protein
VAKQYQITCLSVYISDCWLARVELETPWRWGANRLKPTNRVLGQTPHKKTLRALDEPTTFDCNSQISFANNLCIRKCTYIYACAQSCLLSFSSHELYFFYYFSIGYWRLVAFHVYFYYYGSYHSVVATPSVSNSCFFFPRPRDTSSKTFLLNKKKNNKRIENNNNNTNKQCIETQASAAFCYVAVLGFCFFFLNFSSL